MANTPNDETYSEEETVARRGQRLIIVLGGGDKRTQQKDIATATQREQGV